MISYVVQGKKQDHWETVGRFSGSVGITAAEGLLEQLVSNGEYGEIRLLESHHDPVKDTDVWHQRFTSGPLPAGGVGKPEPAVASEPVGRAAVLPQPPLLPLSSEPVGQAAPPPPFSSKPQSGAALTPTQLPLQGTNMIVQAKGKDEKFCSDCGSVIREKAEICPKCGVRQLGVHAQNINLASTGGASPNGKSRISAILLAFFLGGFGVHKFYLGRTGAGFIYLLFFWTFIPSILAFIDFIILIGMGDSDFIEKYGNT